jgi:hypothetical protein
MAANVCVSSVVRFRSRVLSPTQSVERRYKLWITPHRTIEETFCCGLALFSLIFVNTVNIVVTNKINGNSSISRKKPL